MAAGSPDDRLQRIERAGAEIAINNPECSERGPWCGLTSDARKRRIVFVNNVGWHVPDLLADQSKCIARLLSSRRTEQIEGWTKSVPSSQSDRTQTLGSPSLQHTLVEVLATLSASASWRRANHVGTNFDPARRDRGCWDDSLVGNLRRTAGQYRAR